MLQPLWPKTALKRQPRAIKKTETGKIKRWGKEPRPVPAKPKGTQTQIETHVAALTPQVVSTVLTCLQGHQKIPVEREGGAR